MPPAFITLSDAKAYLRVTSTADDALIASLIQAASGRIETITGQRFEAADYVETISASGDPELTLRHLPIIDLQSVASERAGVLRVEYTGSGVFASVSVTETAVRLRQVSVAGVSSTDEITFANQPVTDGMATAISALSDWTATSLINAPSDRLAISGSASALRYTISLDAILDADASPYVVDQRNGIIRAKTDIYNTPGAWNPPIYDSASEPRAGFQNVVVRYRAGYDPIPADIQQITREMVKAMYEMTSLNSGVQSENLDQYSYTLADQADNEGKFAARLSGWMEIR